MRRCRLTGSKLTTTSCSESSPGAIRPHYQGDPRRLAGAVMHSSPLSFVKPIHQISRSIRLKVNVVVVLLSPFLPTCVCRDHLAGDLHRGAAVTRATTACVDSSFFFFECCIFMSWGVIITIVLIYSVQTGGKLTLQHLGMTDSQLSGGERQEQLILTPSFCTTQRSFIWSTSSCLKEIPHGNLHIPRFKNAICCVNPLTCSQTCSYFSNST